MVAQHVPSWELPGGPALLHLHGMILLLGPKRHLPPRPAFLRSVTCNFTLGLCRLGKISRS